MGREIRRVPPNYAHPTRKNPYSGRKEAQPMYDKTFVAAVEEWKAGYAAWEAGDHQGMDGDYEYWGYAGAPPDDRSMYRPWADAEATWYQVWQTVSEGSPVTPPFETKEELIRYLAKNGDEWDQDRGEGGWGYEAAKRFVDAGWAISFIASDETGVVEGKLRV